MKSHSLIILLGKPDGNLHIDQVKFALTCDNTHYSFRNMATLQTLRIMTATKNSGRQYT